MPRSTTKLHRAGLAILTAGVVVAPAAFAGESYYPTQPSGSHHGATPKPSAPTKPTPAKATRPTTLVSILNGANEVGVTGDPASGASFRLQLNATTGAISFRQIELQKTFGPGETAPTAFHIHKGVAGENGDVVVDFTKEAADGDGRGTVTADPAVVQRIIANPQNYYLNLHTAAFPKGAIRGQLATAPRTRLSALLQGSAEVDTLGDLDGSGTFELMVNPRYELAAFQLKNLRNVTAAGELPTKIHIHRGNAGQNGDVVLDFADNVADGQTAGFVSADPTLLREIRNFPKRFYVNIHTAAFPKGAVRGQLSASWKLR